jgi:hypothetical protein
MKVSITRRRQTRERTQVRTRMKVKNSVHVHMGMLDVAISQVRHLAA